MLVSLVVIRNRFPGFSSSPFSPLPKTPSHHRDNTPGDAALQFKGNWPHTSSSSSGIVHSIDIKETYMFGMVFFPLSGQLMIRRWQRQPIILSDPGVDRRLAHPVSESDIWEVQFDSYLQSSHISHFSSSRMMPVMMCSEDGILASIEHGLEPVELLGEPCAINSFDIDKQNNTNVVCSLEWESIAILTRTSFFRWLSLQTHGH
ncbi:Nuclear pore complex protein NUP43-like protein [Drosera capensis]